MSDCSSASSHGMCKICDLPAHGLHFGVITCRACAAFFRRFVVLNLKYECLNNPQKCNSDNMRRSSCRQCRYQKCIKMGMTETNVQWNRDIYTNLNENFEKSGKRKSISSASTKSQNHKFEEKIIKKSITAELNLNSLESEMYHIFKNDYPKMSSGILNKMNFLEKVAYGLKLIRFSQKRDNIEFQSRLRLELLVQNWRTQAYNIAHLAMHFECFRRIPITEKMRIFKHLWKNIYRLERLQQSAEIFGRHCIEEKKIFISNTEAVRIDDLILDIDGVDTQDLLKMIQNWKSFANRCIEEVAKPLINLKLDTIEVAFLISEFVHHDEDIITGVTLDIYDNFRNEVANNLHDFYKQQGTFNYSYRLSKITRACYAMKKIHYEDLGGVFC